MATENRDPVHTNIHKTVHMTIAPKNTVTKTTEEDIIADQATFMYECNYCKRRFPSQISLSCHYPRWCLDERTADVRPQRNQLANKIIEVKKRAVIVGTQDKIKLNDELITNVEILSI